jgi:ABC-type nitrate/sulfonate/bicarbonate transport system substrate-binding protein
VRVPRLTRALVGAVVVLVAATGASAVTASRSAFPSHVTIAYQPGIGYAPIIMIRQQRLLEKRYPKTSFDWRVLPSATPITNGLVAGQIDFGAIGVGPLLFGWSSGNDWKYLAPLSEADLWLMVKDPNIKSLADLQGKKIAMPSALAIQAVILRKAASVKLGNARALDSSIVALDHPAGMEALLNGLVSAHLTSPPFQFLEQEQGARILVRSYQYFGAHSFVGLTGTQRFYDQHTDFCKELYKLVKTQSDLINKNPARAAAIVSAEAGGSPSAAEFKRWMVNPAIHYSTRPRGLMRFAVFMNQNGFLSRMPTGWTQLVFPPVYATKGS